jgi:hypothetical protein
VSMRLDMGLLDLRTRLELQVQLQSTEAEYDALDADLWDTQFNYSLALRAEVRVAI